MGMSEDERIRSKNRVSNLAYDEFIIMKNLGWSNLDILNHCKKAQKLESNSYIRNNIYSAIIKIVGENNE